MSSPLLKQTKIVCTIGPASADEARLEAMVQAGMNVCRLNFSHGTHENHAGLIEKIRRVSKKTGQPLAILQDLQGPKIRVGELPAEGVHLPTGKEISFTSGETRLPYVISVSYPTLARDLQVGQRLLFDDGLLQARVKRINGLEVLCVMEFGGTLFSHKGMNLPDTDTSISAITEKDKADLAFGIQQGVDYVALSFVRKASDIQELRALLGTAGAGDERIRVIAKVEKPEAVAALDEIIDAADGVMVARGDLGIEIAAERVPLVQKDIVHRCLAVAKPVIVATQMLDSMIRQPRATRAEISDIANAAIDHTDATMLSGESATGLFPLEAVQTMAKTLMEIEASAYDDLSPKLPLDKQAPEAAVTNVVTILSHATHAKGILCFVETGDVARLLSRHRPNVPIFACTHSAKVARQLTLSWGVFPCVVAATDDHKELETRAVAWLKDRHYIAAGDELIFVGGEPLGKTGQVPWIEVRNVA